MANSKVLLFQFVYIIPSIILYIFEIYVMFFSTKKYKFNKSSFNKIFVIYAINNIIADILYLFFYRMGSSLIFYELFDQLLGFHVVLAFLWQLLYHTSMVTNLLDLILS